LFALGGQPLESRDREVERAQLIPEVFNKILSFWWNHFVDIPETELEWNP